jgi:purine-binding chemotaxis protein CheW
MCSVRVGQTLFGIPITHILEIVGGARPQPVPLAPDFVGGLVHYRGDVLTTVSLRHLARHAPRRVRRTSWFLRAPAAASACWSIRLAKCSPSPKPTTSRIPRYSTSAAARCFAGAYKLKEGLLVMLDPERLDPLRLGAAA